MAQCPRPKHNKRFRVGLLAGHAGDEVACFFGVLLALVGLRSDLFDLGDARPIEVVVDDRGRTERPSFEAPVSFVERGGFVDLLTPYALLTGGKPPCGVESRAAWMSLSSVGWFSLTNRK